MHRRIIKKGKADLHIHTTASDGNLTPEQTVNYALNHGMAVIGISDHDSISGIAEALHAQDMLNKAGLHKGNKIIVVPCVEISCEYNNQELHILGYFIDHENKQLRALLKMRQDYRQMRAKRLIGSLNKQLLQEGKSPIKFADVAARAKGSIGRPHTATELVSRGYAKDMGDAFDKYLNAHLSAHKRIPVEKAIRIIKAAGGIPVFAHPYIALSKLDKKIRGHFAFFEALKAKGIEGIEVFTTAHTSAQERVYLAFAKKLGLLITGGSDSHGPGTGHDYLGRFGVAAKYYEELVARKKLMKSKARNERKRDEIKSEK